MNPQQQKVLELYIHIPFCAQKCKYCDFLSFSVNEREHEVYISQLCCELKRTAPAAAPYSISSIFIGGGTPSLLDPRYIARIMSVIRRNYRLLPSAEVTIECNPASTLRYKFSTYRKAGINRISIGLQSANNDELRTLGRIHSFEEFLKCYQSARLEGFSNINIDLMNDIPGQTAQSWKNTLKRVIMLKPEHLSIYNLIVEDGTPFKRMQDEGKLILPSEETQAEIDAITKELTQKHDYLRYEVSNYAKAGYECRHNLGYWSDVPYLGFGLGASSYFHGTRWSNTRSYDEYLRLDMDEESANGFPTLRKDVQVLSRTEQMEEFMFIGLRKVSGVSESDFTAKFSVSIESVFGATLEQFVREGFMTHQHYRYAFTERGMDVSNVLLSRFLM